MIVIMTKLIKIVMICVITMMTTMMTGWWSWYTRQWKVSGSISGFVATFFTATNLFEKLTLNFGRGSKVRNSKGLVWICSRVNRIFLVCQNCRDLTWLRDCQVSPSIWVFMCVFVVFWKFFWQVSQDCVCLSLCVRAHARISLHSFPCPKCMKCIAS